MFYSENSLKKPKITCSKNNNNNDTIPPQTTTIFQLEKKKEMKNNQSKIKKNCQRNGAGYHPIE